MPSTRNRVVSCLIFLAVCSLSPGGPVLSSETTDLKAKLDALEKQIDQEKDKARKDELKAQEKQAKADLKAAQEREKAAAKANEASAKKSATVPGDADKRIAQGFNKFSRFWTEDIGKPMRHFFYGK